MTPAERAHLRQLAEVEATRPVSPGPQRNFYKAITPDVILGLLDHLDRLEALSNIAACIELQRLRDCLRLLGLNPRAPIDAIEQAIADVSDDYQRMNAQRLALIVAALPKEPP